MQLPDGLVSSVLSQAGKMRIGEARSVTALYGEAALVLVNSSRSLALAFVAPQPANVGAILAAAPQFEALLT